MLLNYGLKSEAADKGVAKIFVKSAFEEQLWPQWPPGHQNLLLKILKKYINLIPTKFFSVRNL